MSAAGHPAGRAGHGLVHGRRRVRPGDERRDRHRPRHRHDLPGRPAAGEGRDRRGRHGRGAGRFRGPHPPLRRRRPRGARRRARAGPRPVDRVEPEPPEGDAALGSARPGGSGDRGGRRRPRRVALRLGLGGCAPAGAGPRDHRPARRRLALPRVQAALRRDAGHRLRPHRRLPGRDPGQRRHPVQPVGAQGRPLHRARLPAQDPARLPPEHHRVHGRARVRGGRHRQGRREARDGGRLGRGARSSRSSSAAASGPATTRWPGGPTSRGSCGPGRTRGSR